MNWGLKSFAKRQPAPAPAAQAVADIRNIRSIVRILYADALLTVKLKGIKGSVGQEIAVQATAAIASRRTGRQVTGEEVLSMIQEDR